MLDGDPAPPPPKRGHSTPNFGPCRLWANGWMDQDVGRWIKTEVGLVPGNIVLDGDPAPLPKRDTAPSFWLMSVVAKQLDGSRCQLS